MAFIGKKRAELVQDRPVATMTADLTTGVDRIQIQFEEDGRALEALNTKPEWCTLDWEAQGTTANVGDRRNEALFLQKVRLVFDAAYSPFDDVSAINAQLQAGMDIDELRSQAPEATQPIKVRANLWATGEVSAQMVYDRQKSPLGTATHAQTEAYTQHMMRMALRVRLGVLTS